MTIVSKTILLYKNNLYILYIYIYIYITMNAKDYEAEWKWLKSSEAKQCTDAAKAHALTEFKKWFPSANISRFQVQVDFDTQLGECCFKMLMGSFFGIFSNFFTSTFMY